MRPKSIATVVVVLRSTPSSGSTCTLGAVSCSSVRRGRISLTDPTSVVLPAPNPPATRILIANGDAGPAPSSEPAETIDHLPEDGQVVLPGRHHRLIDGDQAVLAQVGDQDAYDAEWEVEVGGKVDERRRLD